jgi:heat shock protein HslJ
VKFAAALVAVVVALTLALGGCVASGPSAADPRLEGTWHLASGSVRGKGIPLGGRSVTLTIGDATHTGGNDPCSPYSATVTGGIGVVYIRATLTSHTRDDCTTPSLARMQQLYISALTSSKFAAINQGALVLTSPSSTLVYVRTQPAPIGSVQNTTWLLYAIVSQVPTVTAGRGIHPVRLSFDGGSSLSVSSRCVTESANYQIEGENFAISHVITSPGLSHSCTVADRNLSAQAITMIDGPLLLDVSSDGSDSIPMLVITNLDDNLPIVWRADN